MLDHKVVSREAWLEARKALLAREKDLTRLRDELSAERRALPWVRVEKQYVFDAPGGRQTLSDLFDDRSQLIIQHFMFGPDWTEGCVGCSFQADHIDGATVHLEHRDVTLVVVSRASLPRIEVFKRRMGWRFKWVSSYGSDFNYDYHVSFRKEDLARGKVFYDYELRQLQSQDLPGISVFYRDAGDVYHTYSSYARGDELLIGTYSYLDLVPKGRDEEGLSPPMAWVRHHDRYDD
ncbi:MAG TPA: thioredoxin family protein [Gemmatimonadota bacterium]|nr:thioredoxin family protein [Gemmatimonadota bacterium]